MSHGFVPSGAYRVKRGKVITPKRLVLIASYKHRHWWATRRRSAGTDERPIERWTNDAVTQFRVWEDGFEGMLYEPKGA